MPGNTPCLYSCSNCGSLAVDQEGEPIGGLCDCSGALCIDCACCQRHCLCRLSREGEELAEELSREGEDAAEVEGEELAERVLD